MLVRITLLCTLLVSATTIALGQQQPPTQTQTGDRRDVSPAKTPEQEIPHEMEISVYGGGSYFRGLDDARRTKLVRGGILGASFTSNAWNYVSIETGYNYYGVNNLRFMTPSGGEVSLGSRDFAIYVNPVLHFTNRLSRFRPYISGGFGMNVFYPTRAAKGQVKGMNAVDQAAFSSLDTSTEPAFNLGLGVKWRVNKSGSVGLRFDARGISSDNPQFKVVPEKDQRLWGFQPTVGINFWFGKKPYVQEFERTVTVTRTAAVATPTNAITATQIAGAGEVCGGTPMNLSVGTTTVPANLTIRYQWAVNGTNSGTNSNTFAFTPPDAGGEQRVTVTITDTAAANAAPPVTVTQTVRVRPYVRPTVRVTSAPAEVDERGTATAVASTAGDCGGAITTTWTASEGRITANGQNPNQATFDASTVTFPAGGVGDQVKQVTLTATARDTRGQSASGTATVGVRKRAQATQLADIIFAARSAVVNNCGQRILTDDVYPQFRAGSQIVLVGHSDASDRNQANIDRDRANAVARLLVTGGRSPANKVDQGNIKVDWVAADQSAPKKSRQCEASVREVQSRTIAPNDSAAGNRRVEVWLVPAGAAMPASARAVKDLPANFKE
jgi:outer membrane protein OmpA-like peptidoglycan-associated protein